MKNRTIIRSLLLGIKKGYNTPTLPNNILKIQLHPLVRILRTLGGLSFLFVLSKRYLDYPVYLLYLAMLIALIFTIYHFILSYYRIKHIKSLLKSDKLNIRY